MMAIPSHGEGYRCASRWIKPRGCGWRADSDAAGLNQSPSSCSITRMKSASPEGRPWRMRWSRMRSLGSFPVASENSVPVRDVGLQEPPIHGSANAESETLSGGMISAASRWWCLDRRQGCGGTGKRRVSPARRRVRCVRFHNCRDAGFSDVTCLLHVSSKGTGNSNTAKVGRMFGRQGIEKSGHCPAGRALIVEILDHDMCGIGGTTARQWETS